MTGCIAILYRHDIGKKDRIGQLSLYHLLHFPAVIHSEQKGPCRRDDVFFFTAFRLVIITHRKHVADHEFSLCVVLNMFYACRSIIQVEILTYDFLEYIMVDRFYEIGIATSHFPLNLIGRRGITGQHDDRCFALDGVFLEPFTNIITIYAR